MFDPDLSESVFSENSLFLSMTFIHDISTGCDHAEAESLLQRWRIYRQQLGEMFQNSFSSNDHLVGVGSSRFLLKV